MRERKREREMVGGYEWFLGGGSVMFCFFFLPGYVEGFSCGGE